MSTVDSQGSESGVCVQQILKNKMADKETTRYLLNCTIPDVIAEDLVKKGKGVEARVSS